LAPSAGRLHIPTGGNAASSVPCDPRHVRLRCLIVDDNECFLEIASASLQGEDLEVVGTARTSAEALRQVAAQEVDVVLVDINLGDESGFELARELVARFPRLASAVVLISSRAEQDFGGQVKASAASAFVAKTQLSARAVRDAVASRRPSDREET
jgi:DNA-binding NarL/FixJ family response regulator